MSRQLFGAASATVATAVMATSIARQDQHYMEALDVEEECTTGHMSLIQSPTRPSPAAAPAVAPSPASVAAEGFQAQTARQQRGAYTLALHHRLRGAASDGQFADAARVPSASSTPVAADSGAGVVVAAAAFPIAPAGGESRRSGDTDVAALPPLHMQQCVRPLLRIAVPIACTNFVRNASMFLTTYFIGNYLPRNEFAGVGAGLTFTNLTAISIGIGLSCALDTLCSQEFGRDPRSKRLGLHLQRAIVATLATFLPVCVAYFFCDGLLRAIMNDEVAAVAARWARLSIPITIPQLLTTCVQKYAQTQCEPKIPMYAATVGLLTLPPALYLCRGFGVEGVAVALAANRWFMFATVVAFVARNEKLRHNFGSVSLSEALDPTQLTKYFKIGLPSMFAFVADFWSFEVLTVVAAHLGTVEVGAWVVMMNIYSLFFGPSVGVSAASCVKIGNALGAGDGPLARNMMLATLLVATCLASVESLLILYFGGAIYELLTVDAEIVKKGTSIMHVAFATFFVDVFFYVCQGVFRGCKKQGIAALIVCLSMWGVGVPLACWLSIRERMNVMGLVLGLTGGVATASPIFLYFMTNKIDWVKTAKIAAKRQSQQQPQSEGSRQASSSSGTPSPSGGTAGALVARGGAGFTPTQHTALPPRDDGDDETEMSTLAVKDRLLASHPSS